jgi:hypothetical protein
MGVPECPGCRAARARIAELEAKVLGLEGQLRDLMDRLKPPAPPRQAPDLPAAPTKKPTGRKPGAQDGHPAHLKRRMPPERVHHGTESSTSLASSLVGSLVGPASQ